MLDGALGVTALPRSFKSFLISTGDNVAVKLWLCCQTGVIRRGSNWCFKPTESTTLHPRLHSVTLSLILIGRSHSCGLVLLPYSARSPPTSINHGLLFGCLSMSNEGPLSPDAHSGVICVASGVCFLGPRHSHAAPILQPHCQ